MYLKNLDISSAKKNQKTFNMLCAVSPVKISFWYPLELCVNFFVKYLKNAPKWSLTYFQPILEAILLP